MLGTVQLPAQRVKRAGAWIRTGSILLQKPGLQVAFVTSVSTVLHLPYEPTCRSPHSLGDLSYSVMGGRPRCNSISFKL